MKIQEIKKITSNLDGWLTDKEGESLFKLAKRCRGKGVIVEIGSWKGKSTIWLGNGSIAGNRTKTYAIDPHIGSSEHQEKFGKVSTFKEFKENIKKGGVEKLVEPIVKTSEDAAKNFDMPVELIFIDGGHEYELVKKDFDIWFPKVINNGTMAFHDTIGWDGPKRVVDNFVYKSNRFKDVNFVYPGSITYGKKVKKNSFFDQVRNRYIPLIKNIYELAGKLHPAGPIKKLGEMVGKLMH